MSPNPCTNHWQREAGKVWEETKGVDRWGRKGETETREPQKSHEGNTETQRGSTTWRWAWKGADGTDGRDRGRKDTGRVKYTPTTSAFHPSPVPQASQKMRCHRTPGGATQTSAERVQYTTASAHNCRSVAAACPVLSPCPCLPPARSLCIPRTIQCKRSFS